MKEQTIRITKNGDIAFLYTDEHPLRYVGTMGITRASNVEFDAETQLWYMHELNGKRLPTGFANRKDCIDYEVLTLCTRVQQGFKPEDLFAVNENDSE